MISTALDKSAFNDVIKDEPGSTNGVRYFQTDPGFIYSIILVSFMFDDIVDNLRCQRAFNIVILGHHMESWGGIGYTSR